MPLPYVPDRVLWIRFLAALAPGVLLFLLWLSGRGSSGLPQRHDRPAHAQPQLRGAAEPVARRDADCVPLRLSRQQRHLRHRCGGRKDSRNLTADSLDEESEPAFSPDGQVIAFRSGSRGIFTMPAGGGAFTQITTIGIAAGVDAGWPFARLQRHDHPRRCLSPGRDRRASSSTSLRVRRAASRSSSICTSRRCRREATASPTSAGRCRRRRGAVSAIPAPISGRSRSTAGSPCA